MRLPGNVSALFKALVEGLYHLLGEQLHAIYVTGAIVFPETTQIRDIDIHVILTESLTTKECRNIEQLHLMLAKDYPPHGEDLDIFYILLREALLSDPPTHQLNRDLRDESWALHRAHMHAGRRIILHGPGPEQIVPVPAWAELEKALQNELNYVKKVLGEYTAYCVLNLCRIMYSYMSRDVVISKMLAGAWGERTFPQWRCLISLARSDYSRISGSGKGFFNEQDVRHFYRFACEWIERAMKK